MDSRTKVNGERIRAIETTYNGIKFRSRLEARVAKLFDELNATYEYEPEGFDLGDGIWYLPDFRLQGLCNPGLTSRMYTPQDLWVEVKGVVTPLDKEKIRRFVNLVGEPILIMGSLPLPKGRTDSEKLHSILHQAADAEYNTEFLFSWRFINGDSYHVTPCINKRGEVCLFSGDYDQSELDVQRTVRAYTSALNERFERQ